MSISRKQRADQALQGHKQNDKYLAEQSIETLKSIKNSLEVQAIDQQDARKKKIMEQIAQQAYQEIISRNKRRSQMIEMLSAKFKDPEQQYHHKQQLQQSQLMCFKGWSYIFRAIKGMIGSQQQSRSSYLSSQSYFSQKQSTTSSVKKKQGDNNTNSCKKLKDL